jgi:PAS domain S-box-containing protein
VSAEEHNLVLILARGLASSIATPIILVDPEGTVVYYNEPAEEILGQTYAEAGELERHEWVSIFTPKDPESGEHLKPEALPLALAIQDRKPAHQQFRITALDGMQRDIAVTAFPLWARTDEFVGAVAIFWEEKG